MPSLGATYGRGAATLAQWDLANSDCVLVMGSNMAENHPIAFRFVMQAKEKGATVTAYVEKAPRVWVELGYDHPMAAQIKPAERQVLLLRPEREWTAVEDGPNTWLAQLSAALDRAALPDAA